MEPLPLEVARHFCDIDDIQRLAASVDLNIDIHKNLFQRRPGFHTSTREEFGQAVGADVPVDIITCKEVANDVAFFMVERSQWVDSPMRK